MISALYCTNTYAGFEPAQDLTLLDVSFLSQHISISLIIQYIIPPPKGLKIHTVFMFQTPLHYASREDRTEVVTVLLEYGAQVDRVDNNGKVGLSLSLSSFHYDCISSACT